MGCNQSSEGNQQWAYSNQTLPMVMPNYDDGNENVNDDNDNIVKYYNQK